MFESEVLDNLITAGNKVEDLILFTNIYRNDGHETNIDTSHGQLKIRFIPFKNDPLPRAIIVTNEVASGILIQHPGDVSSVPQIKFTAKYSFLNYEGIKALSDAIPENDRK